MPLHKVLAKNDKKIKYQICTELILFLDLRTKMTLIKLFFKTTTLILQDVGLMLVIKVEARKFNSVKIGVTPKIR